MRPQRDADERLRDDDPPEPDLEAPPLFFAEPDAPPEDRADAPPFVDADVFEAADFDAVLPPLFEPPPVDPLRFDAEAERVPPPEDALLLPPFDEPLLADFAAPPELLLADFDAEDPDRVDDELFDEEEDFFAAAEPPFEAALFFAADDRDDDPPDEDLDELFEPDRFAPPPLLVPTSPAMSAAVAAAPITAPFAAPVASSVTTFAASSSTLLTVFVADERREPDVLLFVFAAILVASFFC